MKRVTDTHTTAIDRTLKRTRKEYSESLGPAFAETAGRENCDILIRKILSHSVDVVSEGNPKCQPDLRHTSSSSDLRERFPNPLNIFDDRLTSKLSFGSDFDGEPCDLGTEASETFDYGGSSTSQRTEHQHLRDEIIRTDPCC